MSSIEFDPDPALPWIAAATAAVPVSEQETAVLNRLDGKVHFLSGVEIDILRDMQKMAAMDRQIARMLEQQPESRGVLLAALRKLAADGVILSHRDALARISASQSGAPCRATTISTVAWVTKDRPVSLERSIESFVRNFKKYGHSPRLLVCDDSREPAGGRATKDMLEALSRRLDASIDYRGMDERRGMAGRLDAGLGGGKDTREAVEFGLAGPDGASATTLGSGRNFCLLEAPGEALLFIDDDLVCAPAKWPDASDELRLAAYHENDDLYYYRDRATAVAAVEPVELDVLACHEARIGRSVQELVAGRRSGVRLDPMLPETVLSLIDRPARIAAVVTGFYGDLGSTVPTTGLTLQGEARQRQYFEAGGLELCLESREVVRMPREELLVPPAFFMTTQAALDNRLELPPFFPVFRGQDGLFAALLRHTMPEALVARPAFGFLHDPPARRQAPFRRSPERLVDYPELLMQLVNGWAASAPERSRDTNGLGVHLSRIAGLAAPDFLDFLAQIMQLRLCAETSSLERLLAVHRGQPEHWRRLVQSQLEADALTLRRLEREDPTALLPDRDGRPNAGALAGYLGKFGALALRWNELRACAGAAKR